MTQAPRLAWVACAIAALAALPAALADPAASGPDAGSASGGPAQGVPFVHDVRLVRSVGAQSPTPWQAFDASNLVVYDVDGDGLPEIVASNDNLRHYVIDPRRGLAVAELATTHTGGDGWQGRELGGPAVGDAFGDGGTAIAIDNGDSYLSLWRFAPVASTATRFTLHKLWEVHVDARAWDPRFNETHPWNRQDLPSSEGHPFLADVDGKGRMTVFAQAGQVAAHVAFGLDGSRRWFTDPPVDSNAGAVVADLDGDGRAEVVYASESGPVYVEDARTGAPVWSYDMRCEGGRYLGRGENCDWDEPASITLSPTVADLLGDGTKEVCFGARQAVSVSDPGWYGTRAQVQRNVDASHAKLACLRADGTLLWMQQLPYGNPHSATHPAPFDVDGDGTLDLLWLDWNSIGHRPGNWETTTRGPNLLALSGRDGHVIWNATLTTGWSNQDVSLADVYGDGHQLVLANEFGPHGQDGLSAIDPATGRRVAWVPHQSGWVATRGPMVADLDGDGLMEVVVPVMRPAIDAQWCAQRRADLPCREGAIEILATGQPYSSAFRATYTWSSPAGQPGLLSHPGAAPWMATAGTRPGGPGGRQGPGPGPSEPMSQPDPEDSATAAPGGAHVRGQDPGPAGHGRPATETGSPQGGGERTAAAPAAWLPVGVLLAAAFLRGRRVRREMRGQP